MRDKERLIMQLQKDVQEARRGSGAIAQQPVAMRQQNDVVRLSEKNKFLEHEAEMAKRRELAAAKERDALRAQVAKLQKDMAERPLKRIKEEVKVEIKQEEPVVAPSAAVVVENVGARVVVEEERVPLDYSKIVGRKIFGGDDVFNLFHVREEGQEDGQLFQLTRRLATSASMVVSHEKSSDEVVVSVAQLLEMEPSGKVLLHALKILWDVLSSAPQARKRLEEALKNRSEDAWGKVASFLRQHHADHSEAVNELILDCLICTCSCCGSLSSFDCLEMLFVEGSWVSALFSPGSDASIQLQVKAVNLLMLVICNPVLYKACRRGILGDMARFLSEDLSGSPQDVACLRTALVNLFGVLIGSYADWESATVSDGAGEKLSSRVVLLLFEQVQQLIQETRDHCNPDVVGRTASTVISTFHLLVECTKKIEVGRMFRPNFLSALATLSALPSLHPSLEKIQPAARKLLLSFEQVTKKN